MDFGKGVGVWRGAGLKPGLLVGVKGASIGPRIAVCSQKSDITLLRSCDHS